MTAMAKLTALTARSHAGSERWVPSDSVESGATVVLQVIASAQILKVEAKGPNVPAIGGNNVDSTHQLIGAWGGK